ncbi:hypothetical protein BC332_21879 [Capsicum chinense]|nr:hypothetical protein BC332_21879 [Capsicum chinense]
MCKDVGEDVNHPLLHCRVAVVGNGSPLVVVQWAMLGTIKEVLQCWAYGKGKKSSRAWNVALLVVMWKIWKERNRRAFERVAQEYVKLQNSLFSLVSVWCAHEVGDGGVGFIWLVSEGGQEEEWRHSVAPVPVDKLVEIMQITNEVDIANEDGALLPPSGELGPDSITNDSNEDAEDIRDDSIIFEREVEATFQRAVEEDVTEDHIILEVNSLRFTVVKFPGLMLFVWLSYNMTSADCAGALFYSVMKLALDAPHDSPNELYKNVVAAVRKWKKLLKYYLSSIDEEIEVILKFEEMCLESTREYSPLFVQILHHLYDQEIIQEEAILDWASEKEGAEESDKVFVKQSEKFIQWLKEASEEEDED